MPTASVGVLWTLSLRGKLFRQLYRVLVRVKVDGTCRGFFLKHKLVLFSKVVRGYLAHNTYFCHLVSSFYKMMYVIVNSEAQYA